MAGEVKTQLNKKAKVEKKYAAILAQENIIKLFGRYGVLIIIVYL